MNEVFWNKENLTDYLQNNEVSFYDNAIQLQEISNSNSISIYLLGLNMTAELQIKFIYNANKVEVEILKLDEFSIPKIIENKPISENFAFDHKKMYLPMRTEHTRVFGYIEILGIENPEEVYESFTRHSVLERIAKIFYDYAKENVCLKDEDILINIDNLCVEYKAGANVTKAVKNLNLKIYKNQFTIIVGASGCGKTSLLNSIGTMLTPTSGKIIFNEKNIGDFKDSEKTEFRKNVVGYIFQQYNLIPDLTATENIEVAACLAENPKSAIEMLQVVGLQEKEKNYPAQMSGGEQQRVCIARALAKQPKLLLCDEPTGALDVNNALHVMTILQELVKKHNVPVVMITHNPDFICLADRYIVMSNGSIIEQNNNPFPKSSLELDIK